MRLLIMFARISIPFHCPSALIVRRRGQIAYDEIFSTKLMSSNTSFPNTEDSLCLRLRQIAL